MVVCKGSTPSLAWDTKSSKSSSLELYDPDMPAARYMTDVSEPDAVLAGFNNRQSQLAGLQNTVWVSPQQAFFYHLNESVAGKSELQKHLLHMFIPQCWSRCGPLSDFNAKLKSQCPYCAGLATARWP